MPVVTLTILRGRDAAAKRGLMDAAHAALLEAFRIPEGDRQQRLVEMEPECFEIPGRCSKDFVMVEIAAFAGRSVEAKRALYRALVEQFERRCGVVPADVFIMLDERPLENWGLRGGVAGCDIDFGFRIDV